MIDTNVVLDWLVFNDTRAGPLAAALSTGELRWVSCPAMRAELARMLVHRSLAAWSPDPVAALATHDRLACLADDPICSPARPRCSDADDQVFVDLALVTRARWLLTHDRALLRMARRLRGLGIQVMSPVAWGESTRA